MFDDEDEPQALQDDGSPVLKKRKLDLDDSGEEDEEYDDDEYGQGFEDFEDGGDDFDDGGDHDEPEY